MTDKFITKSLKHEKLQGFLGHSQCSPRTNSMKDLKLTDIIAAGKCTLQ